MNDYYNDLAPCSTKCVCMYRDKGLISGACCSNKCMVICTANYHCMYNKGDRETERDRERGGERE